MIEKFTLRLNPDCLLVQGREAKSAEFFKRFICYSI